MGQLPSSRQETTKSHVKYRISGNRTPGSSNFNSQVLTIRDNRAPIDSTTKNRSKYAKNCVLTVAICCLSLTTAVLVEKNAILHGLFLQVTVITQITYVQTTMLQIILVSNRLHAYYRDLSKFQTYCS